MKTIISAWKSLEIDQKAQPNARCDDKCKSGTDLHFTSLEKARWSRGRDLATGISDAAWLIKYTTMSPGTLGEALWPCDDRMELPFPDTCDSGQRTREEGRKRGKEGGREKEPSSSITSRRSGRWPYRRISDRHLIIPAQTRDYL